MVKSKVWFSLVSLILSAALILSGCTDSSKTPQEALQASMAKSAEMKSYSFKGNLKVEDLNFTASGTDAENISSVVTMLKGMDISWTGAYRADPMLMDMTLSIAIPGDMAINFNIPIIMNKDKIWVKIPNIPIIPLPENLVNKFLELDLKQLAEQSGQPIPSIDPGKSQKLVTELMAIIFKNVDEKEYLSEVKVKEAGLPDGTDVDQVIRFNVTKDQVEPFVQTVVDKIAPEIIDLLSKNAEYREMLGIKSEDLDQAKKELETAKKEDISQGMDEFKKAVKSLDVSAQIGIDGDEYPVYTDMKMNVSIDADGETGNIALKLVSENKDVNKEVSFPNGEPKAENIITMDQLNEQMGGLFDAGMEDLTQEDL